MLQIWELEGNEFNRYSWITAHTGKCGHLYNLMHIYTIRFKEKWVQVHACSSKAVKDV